MKRHWLLLWDTIYSLGFRLTCPTSFLSLLSVELSFHPQKFLLTSIWQLSAAIQDNMLLLQLPVQQNLPFWSVSKCRKLFTWKPHSVLGPAPTPEPTVEYIMWLPFSNQVIENCTLSQEAGNTLANSQLCWQGNKNKGPWNAEGQE